MHIGENKILMLHGSNNESFFNLVLWVSIDDDVWKKEVLRVSVVDDFSKYKSRVDEIKSHRIVNQATGEASEIMVELIITEHFSLFSSLN
jgi:hypothetical protein